MKKYKYNDLTKYEKIRFRKSQKCIICKKDVERFDDFYIYTLLNGKKKIYMFMHVECYSNQDEKELIKLYKEIT